MKTPHPFAHVLEPLARDRTTEFEFNNGGVWIPIPVTKLLYRIANGDAPQRYRVKPATIRIGEREVPKPRSDTKGTALNISGLSFYFDTCGDAVTVRDAIHALMEGRP